jgi:hypothetical protein
VQGTTRADSGANSANTTDTSIRVEKPREACESAALTLLVAIGGGARRAFRHRHRARPRGRDRCGRPDRERTWRLLAGIVDELSAA